MVCTGLGITIFLCKKAGKVSEISSLVLWLKLPERECHLTLIISEILSCSWKLAYCVKMWGFGGLSFFSCSNTQSFAGKQRDYHRHKWDLADEYLNAFSPGVMRN